MKIGANRQKIREIFNRGIVAEVLPSKEELFRKLASGERLRIYLGVDPTSDSLHLSHAKNFMFLEELRQLGHETIVLFGDFTAKIGDPTGRSEARPQLTDAQVKENVKSWLSQIKPLIDFKSKNNPPKLVYNSKWLSKLSFKDVVSLASNFTVQQMMERDMFEKRLNNNLPIHLHEFLYPLMQGYDSVALDVDIELCGRDQTFNALAGRTLLKKIKNKEKFIIALNLMENPKTGELMSKSKGTGVFLSSPPDDMYGAIMAQPDEMIETLFINCTRISLSEKEKIMAMGPRDAKARVAFEIVKKFYGDKKAELAQAEFNKVVSKKEVPSDVQSTKLDVNSLGLVELLVKTGLVASKSEARRLVEQGGVRINGEKQNSPEKEVSLEKEILLQVGRHRYLKVVGK